MTNNNCTLIPSLTELGLNSTDSMSVELITRKDQHTLYRIIHDGSSHVLKWFNDSQNAHELTVYRLLHRFGVLTIPFDGITEQALLMEDLNTSATWRLATMEDIEREKTGVAVAAWYTALHTAGKKLMQAGVPAFLTREVDSLTPESVQTAGERLGFSHLPAWQMAVTHLDQLTREFRTFPETLNYNDFHWTNLALSRDEPLRAIVFDYHLLGIGPVFCDIRNVSGSLGERARAAFREAYGPVDERVALWDAPLSLLYSLQIAAQLPQQPRWVKGCIQQVVNGTFETQLHLAIDSM